MLFPVAIAFPRQLFNLYTLKHFHAMPPHVLYRSLSSVLKVFHDDKYKTDDSVNKLLKIYSDAEKNAKIVQKNHPLIVLEGLDLSGKTTLSQLLAQKLNAVNLKTPPSSVSAELRASFDDKVDLRVAFYSLGNYIAAFEILQTLETRPVVLDRFWHSTTAYLLARNVEADPNKCLLPSKGNPVYRWPADLLQPDIVLFLAVSEEERQRRQMRRTGITKEELMLSDNQRFRQNVLVAYQYMEEPGIQFVNNDATSVEDTLDNLLKSIDQVIPTKLQKVND